MKVLIVDDEPLARAYLRQLLEEQDVQVLGEAESATEALQLNEDLQPELLFLDIQMPGLTGLQLAAALRQSCPSVLIVFVTGYSEHALAAFEHAALDYLVKPVASARLAQTLARARERLASSAPEAEIELPITPLKRLPIRQDYSVLLPRVEEVRSAVAQDKRVVVHLADGEYKTYYTLSQLERLLPSELFLRVHDSCILNLEAVEELLYLGSHAYGVRLRGGQQLPVSRTRFAVLQEKLGVTSR
ncbi:LytTR family DNA-binding domain-containing protein [Armatimonas sp.]|uniref:LytR/AlgR family response regulator transcription factor n=1 Tax=Armatimonas sp. TaxID=1872638 RepID=UPI00286B165E|nr:LytTR family DNA-binding domain-containing protein [Armatimonas sp.]